MRRLVLFALVTSLLATGCTYRFAAWSDSRGPSGDSVNVTALRGLSRQLAPIGPAFTLFPGDLCGAGPTERCLPEWIAAVNGGSTPGNGLASRTFVTRGNHDATGLALLDGMLPPAAAAQVVGVSNFVRPGPELTYAFDFGGDRFVMVDLPRGGVDTMTAAQIQWLDADLSAADGRVRNHFLSWHGPVVCATASHVCAPPRALIDVLNRHPKVRATFHGHEHVNAHAVLNSANVPGLSFRIDQFTAGTGGAPSYPCAPGVVGVDFCTSAEAFDAVRVDPSTDRVTVTVHALGSEEPVRTFAVP